MRITDTLTPYDKVEHIGIQYTTCRDYKHISRNRGLRQVIHGPNHDVKNHEINRLDIIANKYLGSPSYSWVIAYFNSIEDGFTIREGQRLAIPRSLSSLFNKGEILAPVSALVLNLGEE